MGRYELLRVLGKGAMGVVYEGRDPNLDRRVAIKTVKVENLSEEAAAEYEHRFRTEARSAARLQHPNIVSVYDSDRDADVAFLVMEYIQGDDLKHHLDRGVRYSLEQSLKMIRDLLSALDYAHKQGIVHRDIKPANLLLEPGGRVKLTDFGVARIQDSGEATRTQGSMVGTLKYMAPEQVQGQKIDSRADLFSVGVVLYQLLTDQRPFDGDNDFSIIHQIIGHEPPPPSTVNARLPAALDAVVARALAKSRDERFATARDFAVALQAAIRRAEDQTVLPPQNPQRKVETALSRPLSVPGTLPPGTVPGGLSMPGGSTSVTQELELVYWKDVKDSTDPEDLQGFLDKFPTGIYADLARRRLRKLVGGDGTTNITAVGTLPPRAAPAMPPAAAAPVAGAGALATSGTSTMFPDYDATRAHSAAAQAVSEGTGLKPSDWVEQEYTRTRSDSEFPSTVMEVRPEDAAAAAGAAAARKTSSGSTRAGTKAGGTQAGVKPARKKPPIAVLAGIAAVAVAGIVLALTMGRGADKTVAVTEPPPPVVAPAAPAGGSTAAPADAPAVVAAAPQAAPQPAPAQGLPPVPAEQMVNAPAPAPAPAPAVTAAAQPKAKTSQPRAAPKGALPSPVVEQPVRAPTTTMGALPKVDPEPPRSAPAQVVAANNSNFQAVEQCRDRIFLAKEVCLAEHCDKAGARNHPLCVKRREEARIREESRANRGPQQAP
nr:serine/threonine-protein kinase [Ramlibacter paludis]